MSGSVPFIREGKQTVTGYQLREAINRWKLKLTTAVSQFKGSLWTFEGDTTRKPGEILKDVSDCHDAIGRLKEIQQWYNHQVKVQLPDEEITLALAVQLLPGAGQVEKMWREAATDTGRDRYSYGRENSRSKDSEYAQRAITQEEAAKEAKNHFEQTVINKQVPDDAPEFEISEIGKPLVPSPWREVNTLTASYGHGIAVSPLQLVRAASSIVNGGILVSPTIVRQKNSQKKDTKKSFLRVVSPQTSHRMRQLMRLVVTEGTGSKADVAGFMVGSKTGTAEKPGKGGYSRKKLISSFLGFFPMDAPRYAVFIMVREPHLKIAGQATYNLQIQNRV